MYVSFKNNWFVWFEILSYLCVLKNAPGGIKNWKWKMKSEWGIPHLIWRLEGEATVCSGVLQLDGFTWTKNVYRMAANEWRSRREKFVKCVMIFFLTTLERLGVKIEVIKGTIRQTRDGLFLEYFAELSVGSVTSGGKKLGGVKGRIHRIRHRLFSWLLVLNLELQGV